MEKKHILAPAFVNTSILTTVINNKENSNFILYESLDTVVDERGRKLVMRQRWEKMHNGSNVTFSCSC